MVVTLLGRWSRSWDGGHALRTVVTLLGQWSRSYLAAPAHALEDTEEDEDPADSQTGHQGNGHLTRCLYPVRQSQHPAPVVNIAYSRQQSVCVCVFVGVGVVGWGLCG
eukprot:TRINITY_DN52506_c0_g1_i2.p1 TRINITY_DN52506_c0_g1~~TRINITY_DN52506_c0_g1_i2.p1  ORF type:complete len:108 (+),score=8.26 TRINITY_DN52506_c0_g1_i2:189-512(+)